MYLPQAPSKLYAALIRDSNSYCFKNAKAYLHAFLLSIFKIEWTSSRIQKDRVSLHLECSSGKVNQVS